MLVMYETICLPASSPTENIKLGHVEQKVVANTSNLRTLKAEAGGSRAGWRICHGDALSQTKKQMQLLDMQSLIGETWYFIITLTTLVLRACISYQ